MGEKNLAKERNMYVVVFMHMMCMDDECANWANDANEDNMIPHMMHVDPGQWTFKHGNLTVDHQKQLDSHTGTFIVGDDHLVIHDHNIPFNVYNYDPRDDHRGTKTVDAALGYIYLHSVQKYFSIINQGIQINDLEKHLLCRMHYHQNGVLSAKSPCS